MASQEPQDRLKTMTADVRRFIDQGHIVREVHQDTLDVFGKMKSFANRAVSDTAVLTDAQSYPIRRVFDHPPSLVVVGRKDLRRPILNFLVGKDIFPESLDREVPAYHHVEMQPSQQDWRVVIIKHGKQSGCRQIFSDHDVLDSYEVAEAGAVLRSMNRDDQNHNSLVLEARDVLSDSSDLAASSVRLEVMLDMPLLQSGIQVVSCGTHENYSVKNIEECIKERLPFFIFPLHLSSSLSAEVRCLKNMSSVNEPCMLTVSFQFLVAPIHPRTI